jgi:hypothetical protein
MSALSDRIDALVAALASDAALTAWCQTNYGKAHKVFSYMIDLDNPPAEADCPCIQIAPASVVCGNGETRHDRQLIMVCRLVDAEARALPDTNIVEFKGGKNICDFMQLAVSAIAAAGIGNELLARVEAAFGDLTFFPFFMAGMPLSISEDYTLGADRLAL